MDGLNLTSHFGKSPFVIAWGGRYGRCDTEAEVLQEFPGLRTLNGTPVEEF